jgi:hypothetical protein
LFLVPAFISAVVVEALATLVHPARVGLGAVEAAVLQLGQTPPQIPAVAEVARIAATAPVMVLRA